MHTEFASFDDVVEQKTRLNVVRCAIIGLAKEAVIHEGRLDVEALRALLLCEQREADILAHLLRVHA